MTKKIDLSVVIPCFNEMANLQKGVLDKVENYLRRKNLSFEVIISDDGSTDGTTQFVEDFCQSNSGFSLLKNPHLGKAGAVTRGTMASLGQLVLFCDMDQATPIEELDKLLPFIDEGYDIVIGSRGAVRKNAPFTRVILARGMILLRSLITGFTGVTDTQCGFKLFTRKATDILFPKMSSLHDGYTPVSGANVSAGFDVELLFLAQHKGFTIKEVPVRWLHVETRRVNFIKDAIDSILYLLRIRLNQIRGLYQ